MPVDYHALFRDALDAVIVADADGSIIEINPAAEQMLGWPLGELRGQPLTTIIPERYREAHQRGLARYRATGVPVLIGRTIEVDALRHNGEEVRVELSLSVLPSSDRPQFAAIIRDISKVHRLQRAVADAHEHARRLDEEVRLRDEFLSTASHELRTPIAILKMQLGLLERGHVGADVTQRLSRQLHRLEELVERMLDTSRVAAGRLELSRRRFDVADLVREVVAGVQPRSPAHEVRVSSGDGEVPVDADRDRLAEVLFNLVDNAIKYSPTPAPIEIVVSSDGGMARCSVTDHGLGIPASLLPRLFGRFVREGSERVRAIPGLGVGLYISRAIMEGHGGRIGARSDEGEGSTFTFELPIAQRLPRGEDADGIVLVVDDDPDVLDIVLQTLEQAGLRAEGAQNGLEALAAIQRTRPAVVLLDLMMPVMDGWECIRRIRADPQMRDLPVVIFSGDHAVSRKADELGAAGALSKPVSVDRMLALIRRYLPETTANS